MMVGLISTGTWRVGAEYLIQGVKWVDSTPLLDVVDIGSARGELYRLNDEFLGLKVQPGPTYCLGRYSFVDVTGIEHIRCPDQLPSVANGQCTNCAARDEFRFAHHFHTGGYAPDSLVAYMMQPHWLYVATFGDATSKIGTAADVRKQSRLDEQGALAATYVGLAVDGKIARFAEDTVTARLNLRQTKRRSAKVAALAGMLPHTEIEERHAETVAAVLNLLRDVSARVPLELLSKKWLPPPAFSVFLDSEPRTDWVAYPHALSVGEHGFYVRGCAGPAALARTSRDNDAPWFVVDVGALKGRRVIVGNYASAEAMVQTALF